MSHGLPRHPRDPVRLATLEARLASFDEGADALRRVLTRGGVDECRLLERAPSSCWPNGTTSCTRPICSARCASNSSQTIRGYIALPQPMWVRKRKRARCRPRSPASGCECLEPGRAGAEELRHVEPGGRVSPAAQSTATQSSSFRSNSVSASIRSRIISGTNALFLATLSTVVTGMRPSICVRSW